MLSWRRRWSSAVAGKGHCAVLALLQSVAWKPVGKNREEVLEELFTLTADLQPRTVDPRGPVYNPLDMAVEVGLHYTIPLLRARGFMLELLDVYSMESLVQQDRFEDVRAYLQAGISADSRANAGRSVLMVAAAFKAARVMQVLLSWGADVHQRSGFGQWTALMWAAHVGWEEGCSSLLSAKARPEDRNADGVTAIRVASRMGYRNVESLLLHGLSGGH